MKGSAGRSAGMITTALAGASVLADEPRWELAGVSVTPHLRAASMRFRRDPDEANGALVRLFIRGGEDAPARGDFRFNGARPPELVASGAWAWSDAVGEEAAADDPVPKGALTVVTFNTRAAEWDRGSRFELRAGRRGETVPGNDEAATAAGKGAGAPGNGGRLEACPTRIFEAAAHPAWRHPETTKI